MDLPDRSQLLAILQARRSAIATSWHKAVARTGFAPLGAAELRERFDGMTKQVIDLLSAEPFERREARAIGASLSGLHLLNPETISRTQEVLARELERRLGNDQKALLQERLIPLLSEVAAGFFEHARDTVLAEQESIKAALLEERELNEEALRRSEASLAEAQRVAHLGHWEHDLDRNELRWSDEIFRIFDLDKRTFGATLEAFRERVHPDDLELVDRMGGQAAFEGKPAGFEHRIVRPGGEVRFVHQRVEPLLGVDGRPLRLLGTVQDVTERKRAEEALRESEARFRSLIQNSSDIITVVAVDGIIRYQSPSMRRILGHDPEERIGKNVFRSSLIHPDDRAERKASLERVLDSPGASVRHEMRMQHKDGSWRYIEATTTNLLDEPSVESIVINSRDVTERLSAEQALRRSERELAEAQRIAHVGNWSMEVAEHRIHWSNEMYRIAGFAPQEFVVTLERVLELVHPDDREPVREAVRRALQRNEDRHGLDYRLVRPDGEVRFLHSEYEVERDGSGRPVRLLGATQDVTERKVLERELEHQALHDPLTGLANRVLFSDRLGHALARAERGEGKVAVLFLDLDNFKYVNDSLGHEVGDRLLVAVADRLRLVLRPEDTAARLGGDEFAVLLEGVGGGGEAERVAGRIVEGLREPFALEGGQEVYATPSIGIAVGGAGGEAPEDLLRRADLAMYRAKGEGKARYEVFEGSMEAQTVERLGLENDLRRALERNELVVRYQPVVRLSTGRIAGFEALIRWEHPERGLVLPAGFVALAEETGLIVPIGRRVLGEACRQAKEWQERHPYHDPPLLVGVNLSPRQLSHPGLVGDVEAALEESGLEPERLTLEITEGAVVGDAGRHVDALRQLREIGVRIALDDFGTGYSSLSYLRRLPVGMLKIDRSFVEGIGVGAEENEVLLAGVVGIAHGLGLQVCAEGVETPEQLARAKALGCDLAQGHLLSKPLPGEAAARLLSNP